MSEYQVIQQLNTLKGLIEGDFPLNFQTAIDAAIKALEKDFADGCVGCVFEDVEEWEMPCVKCSKGCKDYWRAKK